MLLREWDDYSVVRHYRHPVAACARRNGEIPAFSEKFPQVETRERGKGSATRPTYAGRGAKPNGGRGAAQPSDVGSAACEAWLRCRGHGADARTPRARANGRIPHAPVRGFPAREQHLPHHARAPQLARPKRQRGARNPRARRSLPRSSQRAQPRALRARRLPAYLARPKPYEPCHIPRPGAQAGCTSR